MTDYIIDEFGFYCDSEQKEDFKLAIDYYFKKFDCGKAKPRHLNQNEFSIFWKKFSKIYTTIDRDASGEIEFEELLRYLKITVKKMNLSKLGIIVSMIRNI